MIATIAPLLAVTCNWPFLLRRQVKEIFEPLESNPCAFGSLVSHNSQPRRQSTLAR